MRRLQPGVYLDSQAAIHFDLHELCVAAGYPPTKENADMIERAARAALRKAFGREIPTTMAEN
jgi:hypothetical protein